jgi:hypothetical protein
MDLKVYVEVPSPLAVARRARGIDLTVVIVTIGIFVSDK